MNELDGRKINRKALEEIRILAVKRVEAGESAEVVIQALGLARPRIYEWIARYREGLFVVSSGFEELLDRRSQQVDDADERVIVSVSPGPAFGGLEDAVERFEASVAVA